MPTALLPGLLTGLSLIVAIGAQNAFVLRQGLTNSHVPLVVGICIGGDVLLIVAGAAGLGAVVSAHPTLLTVLRIGGAAYLLWFGLRSLASARRTAALDPATAVRTGAGATAGAVAITALTLTFLNPHVYLDTVLMLGTVAQQYGSGRWWFALGAVIASVTWFATLGFGARAASGIAARPRVWQLVDLAVGLVMITLAVLLVLPVVT